jgi:hypothetical protein
MSNNKQIVFDRKKKMMGISEASHTKKEYASEEEEEYIDNRFNQKFSYIKINTINGIQTRENLSVIYPAIPYQFSTAPASLPLLKRFSTLISSTTKKKLRLPNDFPTAFIFSKFAFDPCDTNNSLANPIPLNNCCPHHPFSHSSNLLSHYKISLFKSRQPYTPRASSLLTQPASRRQLNALRNLKIGSTTQLGGPTTTLSSYGLSAKLASRKLPSEIINVIHNYNDAPDDSNTTSTCTCDVYKWKHWIFAA